MDLFNNKKRLNRGQVAKIKIGQRRSDELNIKRRRGIDDYYVRNNQDNKEKVEEDNNKHYFIIRQDDDNINVEEEDNNKEAQEILQNVEAHDEQKERYGLQKNLISGQTNYSATINNVEAHDEQKEYSATIRDFAEELSKVSNKFLRKKKRAE